MRIILIMLLVVSCSSSPKGTLDEGLTKDLLDCCGSSYEGCKLVYMVSWCPACKNISSKLGTIQNRLNTAWNTGLCSVVGDKEDFLNKLPTDGFFDVDKSIQADLKVPHYPAFYDLDRDGNFRQVVVKRVKDYNDFADQLAK